MRTFLTFIFIGLLFWSYGQNDFTGSNIIGRGYDIFGHYANAKSIKRYPIFNFGLNNDRPKVVMLDDISNHYVRTIEGKSIAEYSKNMALEAGVQGNGFFFKAGFDVAYNSTSSSNNANFYYNYMDVITKWRISLDTRNLDAIIPYLDQTFKRDLEQMNPKDLFETYGTHFIASAYIGGRIDYVSASKLNETTNTTQLKAALEAKYKVIQGGGEFSSSQNNILQSSSTRTSLLINGGDSELTNSINNSTDYQNWAKSISHRPTIAAFDKNGLLPIWTLTKNQTRINELKKYFESTVLMDHPLPSIFEKDEVLDNTDFIANYKLTVVGYQIHQACDNYVLTGKQPGDFTYDVNLLVNGYRVGNISTKKNMKYVVNSGDWLVIKQERKFSIALKKGAYVQIQSNLIELDDLRKQVVGKKSIVHHYPFAEKDLYNFKATNGSLGWTEQHYASSDCNATFLYSITKYKDKTAISFGNKGWESYMNGDYDSALSYSKEALKIDNSLWYVQYNVGLLYLIKGNPNALEKYKLITSHCTDKKTIKAALDDILTHETKHGALNGSEKIKILLRSKL